MEIAVAVAYHVVAVVLWLLLLLFRFVLSGTCAAHAPTCVFAVAHHPLVFVLAASRTAAYRAPSHPPPCPPSCRFVLGPHWQILDSPASVVPTATFYSGAEGGCAAPGCVGGGVEGEGGGGTRKGSCVTRGPLFSEGSSQNGK